MKRLTFLIVILAMSGCGAISSDYVCKSDSSIFDMKVVRGSDTESLSIFKLTKNINIGSYSLDYKENGNKITFKREWDIGVEKGNRNYTFDLITLELSFIGYTELKRGALEGKNIFSSRSYECKEV